MRVPPDRWILNIFDLAYVDDHTYVRRDDNLLIVDWALLIDMHKREVIYLAWKVIFEQLMLTNKEHQ